MQAVMERPFYTRIALLGVAMFLLVAAIILVPILILEPEAIIFPIILSVPALIIGALIFFVRPWGLSAGVLGGLLGLMFSSDGIGLTATSPQAFFDFLFPVVLLPASIFLIAGSVTGLVQHFRKVANEGNPTVAMAVKGVLGVIGVLMAVSLVLTVANLGNASAEDKEGAVFLEMKHTEFEPTEGSTSRTGKLVIENNDPILHTFTIDALDIDIKVGPGSFETYTLDNVAAGEYGFYCRVSGHEDMDGVLTVR
jgi:uncharacterized cupredoxin-like copper-binding protein